MATIDLNDEFFSLLTDYLRYRPNNPVAAEIVAGRLREIGLSDEDRDCLLDVLNKAQEAAFEDLAIAKLLAENNGLRDKLGSLLLDAEKRLRDERELAEARQAQALRTPPPPPPRVHVYAAPDRPDWKNFWAVVLATLATLLVAGAIFYYYIHIRSAPVTGSIEFTYDIGAIIQALLGGTGVLVAGLAYAFRRPPTPPVAPEERSDR